MWPAAFSLKVTALAHLLVLLNYASADRADAFIGYTERRLDCQDQLSECKAYAHQDGCLTDPYTYRQFCPLSCNVERCIASGNIKVRTKGFASGVGTDEFRRRWVLSSRSKPGLDPVLLQTPARFNPAVNFRSLKASGENLVLSSLGVGTYLGGAEPKTDEAVTNALIYSIANGWNVIDTASNYRYGRAEVSVGRALDALLAGSVAASFLQDRNAQKDITRDMLFISTKAGFTDQKTVKRLIKSKMMNKTDVVSESHSMHPAYIKASLETSLQRLGLETVDLLYLHNAAEVQLPVVGRERFMTQLFDAFTALEALRGQGRIRNYGLATWTCFRLPPGDPNFLSLEAVVNVAIAVGGPDHGFKFIQLPVNAAMPESWMQSWQPLAGTDVTLMSAATALGIGVFGSGPLLEADLLKRLTSALDPVVQLRQQQTTAQKLLHFARSTPGVLTSLVGHKTREYVEQNVALTTVPPISPLEFLEAYHVIEKLMQ